MFRVQGLGLSMLKACCNMFGGVGFFRVVYNN